MKKRGLDLVFTILFRFGGKALNMIVFVILSRVLSLDEFGLYGYVFATTLVLSSVMDFGTRNSLAHMVGANPDDASKLTWISFIFWVLFSVSGSLLLYFIYKYFSVDIASINVMIPAILVFVLMLFVRIAGGLALGFGHIGVFNKGEMVGRVVLISGTAALWLTGFLSLSGALYTLCAAQFSSCLYLAVYASNSVGGGARTFSRSMAASLLRRGTIFAVSVVLMHVVNRSSFLVFSQVSGDDARGLYFGLQRMAEILTEVCLAVSVVAFSYSVRSPNRDEAAKLAAETCRTTLLVLTLAGVGMIVFAPQVLTLFLGSKFAIASEEFRVVVLGTLVGGVWTILFPSLSSIASPRACIFAFLPAVIVCVPLLFAFVSFWGMMGAAVAYFLINLLVSLSFIRVFNSQFGIPWHEFVFIQPSDFSERLTRKFKARK